MNWLNIHTDTLRSEEYLGAEPVERATWLNLMAWCASQENGGIIEEAATWGERKWMQLCGVTKQEATLVSKLFCFTPEGALVVSLYPSDKENEVKTKRGVARANGKLGGRPPKEPTSVSKITNVATHEEPTLQSGREGKGKEKEKENGKEYPPTPPRGNGVDLKMEVEESRKPDPIRERLGAIYKRRPSTKWSKDEEKAYKELAIDPADLALVEDFHAVRERESNKLYRRTTLLTLIRHFSEEVDRSRSYFDQNRRPTRHKPSSAQEWPNEFARWHKESPWHSVAVKIAWTTPDCRKCFEAMNEPAHPPTP